MFGRSCKAYKMIRRYCIFTDPGVFIFHELSTIFIQINLYSMYRIDCTQILCVVCDWGKDNLFVIQKL